MKPDDSKDSRAPSIHFSWTSPVPVVSENGHWTHQIVQYDVAIR